MGKVMVLRKRCRSVEPVNCYIKHFIRRSRKCALIIPLITRRVKEKKQKMFVNNANNVASFTDHFLHEILITLVVIYHLHCVPLAIKSNRRSVRSDRIFPFFLLNSLKSLFLKKKFFHPPQSKEKKFDETRHYFHRIYLPIQDSILGRSVSSGARLAGLVSFSDPDLLDRATGIGISIDGLHESMAALSGGNFRF